MEKIVTARHFNIHEDAKTEIHQRLVELETEYRNLTSTRVILDREKNAFSAELIIYGGRIDVEATAKAKDPVHAFELAFEKANRQLRKKREKRQDHKCAPISQLECEIGEAEMELSDEEVAS